MCITGNPGTGSVRLTLVDFGCDGNTPPPTWLPEHQWEDVMALSVFPAPLEALCVQLVENSEAWRGWYESDRPEVEELPLQTAAPQTGTG